MTEFSKPDMNSKIIDKDDAVTVSRWDYPAVDESAAQAIKGAHGSSAHLLTAHQVDALQTQAHEEAYQRGFEEGLAAGNAEVQARVERLDRLLMALGRPLHDLDHSVERELLELAAALARQILHRELKHDPGHIITVVQDCLDVLPGSAREVALHLNPKDVALITKYLSGDSRRPWRVEEDSTLEQGSLRISSDSSQIDGRVHVRLKEIIAAAIAGLSDSEQTP